MSQTTNRWTGESLQLRHLQDLFSLTAPWAPRRWLALRCVSHQARGLDSPISSAQKSLLRPFHRLGVPCFARLCLCLSKHCSMLVVFCGAASWFWTQGEGSSLLQSMFFCSIRYGFTQLQQRSQQDSAVSFVVTCEGFGRRYRGVCSCQGTLSFAPGFFVLISGKRVAMALKMACCALHLSNMHPVAQIPNVGLQTRLCDPSHWRQTVWQCRVRVSSPRCSGSAKEGAHSCEVQQSVIVPEVSRLDSSHFDETRYR